MLVAGYKQLNIVSQLNANVQLTDNASSTVYKLETKANTETQIGAGGAIDLVEFSCMCCKREHL